MWIVHMRIVNVIIWIKLFDHMKRYRCSHMKIVFWKGLISLEKRFCVFFSYHISSISNFISTFNPAPDMPKLFNPTKNLQTKNSYFSFSRHYYLEETILSEILSTFLLLLTQILPKIKILTRKLIPNLTQTLTQILILTLKKVKEKRSDE